MWGTQGVNALVLDQLLIAAQGFGCALQLRLFYERFSLCQAP